MLPAAVRNASRVDASGVKRHLLRPFFRYSYSRDAWVLKGVGKSRGPVYRDL